MGEAGGGGVMGTHRDLSRAVACAGKLHPQLAALLHGHDLREGPRLSSFDVERDAEVRHSGIRSSDPSQLTLN